MVVLSVIQSDPQNTENITYMCINCHIYKLHINTNVKGSVSMYKDRYIEQYKIYKLIMIKYITDKYT